MMTPFLNAFAGLLFVLGLIFGLNWLLKRFGCAFACHKTTKIKNIEILEACPLDMKNRLSLVKVHGKEFLIASGEKNLVVASFDTMTDNQKTEQQGD